MLSASLHRWGWDKRVIFCFLTPLHQLSILGSTYTGFSLAIFPSCSNHLRSLPSIALRLRTSNLTRALTDEYNRGETFNYIYAPSLNAIARPSCMFYAAHTLHIRPISTALILEIMPSRSTRTLLGDSCSSQYSFPPPSLASLCAGTTVLLGQTGAR